MSRYTIVTRDGRRIDADDYRIDGQFVQWIQPYEHRVHSINSLDVVEVRWDPKRWQGGMKFTEEGGMRHDASF
jgi:hypothetical protein